MKKSFGQYSCYGLVASLMLGFVLINLNAPLEAASVRRSVVLHSVTGMAQIQRGGAGTWLAGRPGMLLRAGDRVKTGPASSVVLRRGDGTTIKLSAYTNFEIQEMDYDLSSKTERSSFRTHVGKVWVNVGRALSPSSKFEVQTPVATAAVRGTKCSVEVMGDETSVFSVWKGHMIVIPNAQPGKRIPLTDNMTVIIKPGENSPDKGSSLTEQDIKEWKTQKEIIPPNLILTDPFGDIDVEDLEVTVAGKTDPTAKLTINGQEVPVDGNGQFRTKLTLSLGNNVLTVTATDALGTSSQIRRTIKIKAKKPKLFLKVETPRGGEKMDQSHIQVSGSVLPGAIVTIASGANSINPSVDGNGQFSGDITLTEGSNQISITAKSDDGIDSAQEVRTVTYGAKTVMFVRVNQPQSASTVNVNRVTVSGSTLAGASVNVSVGTSSNRITADQAGAFSSEVTLAEGANQLTTLATSVEGADTAQDVRTVTYNLPMTLRIDAPQAGATVQVNQVTVSGVTSPRAIVTITAPGGMANPIADSSGNFSVTLQLVNGPNQITILARSATGGGTLQDLRQITYRPPFKLEVYSPQTGDTLTDNHVKVTGLTLPQAIVTIASDKGGGASPSVDANGNFTADMTVVDGRNQLTITSRNPATGDQAQEVRTVTYANMRLLVTQPSTTNLTVTKNTLIVSGILNGSSADPQANVYVNGVRVLIQTGGQFQSNPVPLVPGPNTILVRVDSNVQQVQPVSATVVYQPPYVKGIVRDLLTKNVLQGVAVTTTGTAATATNGFGEFQLQLVPGTYTFIFEKTGYLKKVATVLVKDGEDTQLSFVELFVMPPAPPKT